ncbi:unnamed protein product [Malus baccata var. baccata]
MKNRSPLSERPVFLVVILVLLIDDGNSVFYAIAEPTFLRAVDDAPATIQLQAILHYATSSQTPQQSRDEIIVSFEVLKSRSPCNFLENPKWVQTVLKDAPQLRAETVRYRTQLNEADELLSSLALDNLPDEVYDKEWDLIMVDAPHGYFPEARGSGVTHVFLHDVDRKVEKAFAEEFFCRKFLVKAVGRLWHFEIPSAANVTHGDGERFC